jgi:hypothetical protein
MGLVVRWLVECDRGAALEGDFNTMHVTGMALCEVLAAHEVHVPMPADDATIDMFLTPHFDVRTSSVRAL